MNRLGLIEPSRSRRGAGSDSLLVVAVAVLLVAGIGTADGGFFPRPRAIATVAVSLLILWVATTRGWSRPSRLELISIAGLAGLAVWAALAGLLSSESGASWDESGRPLLYAMVVAVAVRLTRTTGVEAVLGGALLGVGAVVCSGLIPYLTTGSRLPDPFQGRLLQSPVGYANAMGLLAVIGLLLALGFARHGATRSLRTAAAVALVPLASALTLTSARAAWLALGLGLVTIAALDHARVEAPAVWGSAGAVLATLASGLCAHLGLDTTSSRLLALGLALLSIVVGAGAHVATESAWIPRRRPTGMTLVAVGLAATAAVLLALVAAPIRSQLSLGARGSYWRVALDQWGAHPWLGDGPGTFGRALLEATGEGARDAHSLYLETLAELGVVGLALVVVALAPPVVAGLRARSSPLVPTGLAAYVAFLAHAGVDWDWEMPTVTIAGLLCGVGLLVSELSPTASQPASPRRRLGPVLMASLVVGVAVLQLARVGALG